MRRVGFLVLGLALLLQCVSSAFAAEARPLVCPTPPDQSPWPKPGEVRVVKGVEIYQPTSTKTVFVAGEGGYRPFELFLARQEMYVADNVPDGAYAPPEYGFLGRVSCDYSYTYQRRPTSEGSFTVNGYFGTRAGFPRDIGIGCSIAERRCHFEIDEVRGEDDAAAFLVVRFSEEFPDGEICLMGGWSGPPYPHPSINLYVDGVRMVHIPHESLSKLDGEVPCEGAGSAPVLAAMKRAKRVDYERVRQPGDRYYTDPNHDHEYLTERSLKSLSEVCDFASWLLKHTVLSDERAQVELKLRPAADALLQTVPGDAPVKPKVGD